MSVNVEAELHRLAGRSVPQLRVEYEERFGEPTNSNNRDYLIKRVVWRIQAQAEGDLSTRARQRAEQLANDADIRMRAPSAGKAAPATAVLPIRLQVATTAPTPGTLLIRDYKDQRLVVHVLEQGFEYDGKVYRSLSAVAKAITGSHWNGNLFFGIKPARAGLEASR